MLANLGGGGSRVQGAFQNGLSGARFLAWFTSLITGNFSMSVPELTLVIPIISCFILVL